MILPNLRLASGWITGRVVALGLASALLVLAALGLLVRHKPNTGSKMARAIESGYGQARSYVPGQLDDMELAADEIDAGYMWARSNRPNNASDCPTFSAEFRKGCADYVTRVQGKRRGAFHGLLAKFFGTN